MNNFIFFREIIPDSHKSNDLLIKDNSKLEFLIHPESWNYKSFTEPIYGFYMFIHQSDDFIDFPTEWSSFQPSYHIRILILPEILRSDENIRSIGFKQRQCIFQNENILQFSRKYSYWSCLAECRAYEILKLCNCIPFYYPHLSKYYNWIICGKND